MKTTKSSAYYHLTKDTLRKAGQDSFSLISARANYSPMTQRWSELSRVYFPCKLEEGTWISPEIMNVKHGLGVRQVREVHCKSGIYSITAPKVRYATRDRHLKQTNNVVTIWKESHPTLNNTTVPSSFRTEVKKLELKA